MEKRKSDNKENSTKSNDSNSSSEKTTPPKKGKLKADDENALKDFLVDQLNLSILLCTKL